MRRERTESTTYPQARASDDTCTCTIHLGRAKYKCLRAWPHDGMHDAFARGPDGFLVRW